MKIVNYKSEYGKINYPDRFEKKLEILTIKQQMKLFRIGNGLYLKKPFLERRFNKYDRAINLEDDKNIKAIIVHNNKIAGILVVEDEYNTTVSCMVELGYCSYYAEELDGSGYKEVVHYSYLFCVGENFDLDGD